MSLRAESPGGGGEPPPGAGRAGAACGFGEHPRHLAPGEAAPGRCLSVLPPTVSALGRRVHTRRPGPCLFHTHTHRQAACATDTGGRRAAQGTAGASPLPGQSLLQALALICSPLSSTGSPACRQILFPVKNLSPGEDLLLAVRRTFDLPLHSLQRPPVQGGGWHPAGPSVPRILVRVATPLGFAATRRLGLARSAKQSRARLCPRWVLFWAHAEAVCLGIAAGGCLVDPAKYLFPLQRRPALGAPSPGRPRPRGECSGNPHRPSAPRPARLPACLAPCPPPPATPSPPLRLFTANLTDVSTLVLPRKGQ